MSGAQQISFMNQRSFGLPPPPPPPPLAIGDAYGGGFFAGQIGVGGVATHNLVVGPLSAAEFTGQWRTNLFNTPGTGSVIDGPGNTAAMIANSAEYHPCGQFCDNLVLGGFSDWYMPAKNELEVCYFNLKPSTTANSTSSGINANAVPARASNYTSGTPAQTSAANFITSTGAEAFTAPSYWSSTEWAATSPFAFYQYFTTGYGQGGSGKQQIHRVRAVRRIPV